MSYQNITPEKNILFKNHKIWNGMIFILALSGGFSVSAADLLDSQALVQELGIQQNDLANLEQGKTVSFNVVESNEKELAAGVAIYLPTAPAKIIEFIKNKNLGSIDTLVTAQGIIPAQATLDKFKSFGYKVGDEEAEDFLAATPGSQFNLSTLEFQTLLQHANSRKSEVASQAYRNILLQRWQAYRQNGLKGIATYDRGNGTEANPSGELRTATLDSKVLARYFPELYKAWLNYPTAFPAGTDEQFFWLNRKVESRPTAILGHRVIVSTDAGEVILARQFYVGHSYNSNQLSIACLPYREGSLVFYANRSFTDQVAGFGSSLKHKVGREQMRDEIVSRLNNLRKAFK